MTAQMMETIIIKDQEYNLASDPLEDYISILS